LHWDGGGAVITNPPEVLQQLIEFFERRSASAFVCFFDQPEFFNNNERVVEGLSC
jgi:hypothetical protein